MGPQLVLIGGGVRSGKSRIALSRARALGLRRRFVATAEALDDEMAGRIARHQRERGSAFETVEAPVALPQVIASAGDTDVLLVDCVTLWLSNLLVRGLDEAQVLARIDALLQALRARPCHVVLVSNEVGMGVVPESRLGRLFRDLAGIAHQRLAADADEVYLAVLGMVLRLRPGPVAAMEGIDNGQAR